LRNPSATGVDGDGFREELNLRFGTAIPPQFVQRFDILCCRKSSVALRCGGGAVILLTVRPAMPFCPCGAQRTVVMIEIVTALFAMISVSIFVAHACEGFLSRA
jgi:hypothetical protein